MAIVVKEDLKAGSEYVQDDSGQSDRRRFNISGLTPGSGIRLQAAAARGVPQYGDAHPNNASLYATQRVFRPFLNSNDTITGDITYRPADDTNLIIPTVEFHATTKEILTSRDNDGKIIQVKYTPPGGTEVISIGRIPATIAEGTLIVNRFESAIPKKALTYLNKVNVATFQSQPPRCWFMRDVSFKLQLTRPGYRVQYVVDYNELTFDDVAIYLDPISGYPPGDISVSTNVSVKSGNGWVRPNIKGTADFNSLRLPRVF